MPVQRKQKNNIISLLGKPINGEIKIPGDKSICIRAILLTNIFYGDFTLENFNFCDDCMTAVSCMDKLASDNKSTIILDCKNSATTMRLLAGLICGMDQDSKKEYILTGDESLKKRPMDRIILPLRKMGANIVSHTNGRAPLYIKPAKLKSISYKSKISSAQVKSCLELAAFCSKNKLSYKEPAKSRDHTSIMIRHFKNTDSHKYIIPSDPSSAAFFLTNAILYPNSNIKIKNLCINKTRMGFYAMLRKMGIKNIELKNVRIMQGERNADLSYKTSSNNKLNAIKIPADVIPSMIDEVPLLILLAAFARGNSVINGISELRVKESDRIKTMTYILDYIGARYKVAKDKIEIYGDPHLLEKIHDKKRKLDKKEIKALKELQKSKDHRILLICKILNIDNLKFKNYLHTSL